jgi:two-component system nitrate/nitrite response regulator NarL
VTQHQRQPLLIALHQKLVSETLAIALEDVGFEVSLVERDQISAVPAGDAEVTVIIDVETPDDLDVLLDLSARAHVLVLSSHVDEELVAGSFAGGARGVVGLDASLDEMREAAVAVSAGRTMVRGVPLKQLMQPEASSEEQLRTWHSLTARERVILARLVRGESTATIAAELGIAQNTARTHIQNILAKLDVHSRLEAAAVAVREGLG